MIEIRKNKKGQDKMISMYWFVILVLIAGGVVMMVNTFYSSPYDVREIESKILAERVADCVYPFGEFNLLLNSNGVFREEFKDNFLERCRLDFTPSSEFNQGDYYVKVEFFDVNYLKNARFEMSAGNENLVPDCKVEANKKKLGQCYTNEFWANDLNDKLYLVKILTIIKKVEENTK